LTGSLVPFTFYSVELTSRVVELSATVVLQLPLLVWLSAVLAVLAVHCKPTASR
jgi:hypothetical protein